MRHSDQTPLSAPSGLATPTAAGVSPGKAVPVGARVSLRVPASSANLGPGYDTMGLALGLYDELTVTRTAEGLAFELEGEGAETVPRTPEHLIVRAIRAAWAAAGLTGELPGLRIRARGRIPHSRGLGSSASAIVAGVVAGSALLPEDLRLSQQALLQVCSDLEGHPDNVAPSLFGGLAISWGEEHPEGQRWRSARVPVDPRVHPVVAVPDYEVSTRLARELIPAQVPHALAAADAGRAALLVRALSGAPELLPAATRDYLHQEHRSQAMVPTARMVRALRERGFPAVVSGAGPSALVLAESAERAEQAAREMRHLAAEAAGQDPAAPHWRIEGLAIDASGVTLVDEERPIRRR